MASSVYEDDSSDSNLSQDSSLGSLELPECAKELLGRHDRRKNINVIHKLNLRQVYGRVARNPKAGTENLLPYVHYQCKYQLGQIVGSQDALNHIFMGFTLCGRYFVSYTEKYVEDSLRILPTVEYELYIWRFIPGKKLRYIAKYRIFKLLQGHYILRDVMFVQFPTDPYRLICYGSYVSETVMAFLTILTLPSLDNCKYCKLHSKFEQGWCLRHGFMIHHSFSLTQSFTQEFPAFDPYISLAYPDHFVINTGVNIHILNIRSSEPPQPNVVPSELEKYDEKIPIQQVNCASFADNTSEVSETSIDNFSTNSTIEAILEDFSEYDLESAECNRPFHELNISCEPLNVTGIRSPMLSPNSRNGQFRSSPHYSRSPISPRECARKFHVYSPGLDSDCSDCDSKLILKQPVLNGDSRFQHNSVGLLIVDANRKEESSKWIKKVVKRYSSVDYFENSSLVSGQSKDDYNMPIEIPLIVQNLADLQFDVVPDFKADQVTETQLIITQRTFDCEQFVQRRAQKLCLDRQLRFLYCEDYDVKLLHICPINGDIVCQAVIKISALRTNVAYSKPEAYIANCVFTWNIATDTFELIEPPDYFKMQLYAEQMEALPIEVPPNNCRRVLVMDFNGDVTKKTLRDYNNCYEIVMESDLLTEFYD